jgi:hypothetical protein
MTADITSLTVTTTGAGAAAIELRQDAAATIAMTITITPLTAATSAAMPVAGLPLIARLPPAVPHRQFQAGLAAVKFGLGRLVYYRQNS